MNNVNDEKIVLRSDDSFKYHERLKQEEKRKEALNKPIPSFDPVKCGCSYQAYKRYYEGKNPWIEFG